METDEDDATKRHLVIGPKLLIMGYTINIFNITLCIDLLLEFLILILCKCDWRFHSGF